MRPAQRISAESLAGWLQRAAVLFCIVLPWLWVAPMAAAVERVIDLPGFPVEGRATGLTPPWESTGRLLDGASISSGVSEQLRQLPGLVLQSGFGDIDPPRLSVRGSGLQSAPVSRGLWIEWDGQVLNAADGSFNLALLESIWLREIQLVSGGWASAPAMGGCLQFSSAFADTDAGSGLLLRAGSYGRLASALRQSGSVASADWALGFAHSEVGGWRERSRQQRQSLQALVAVPIGAGSNQLQLRSYAIRAAFDVPGPLSLNQLENDPKAVSPRVRTDQPRRETDWLQLSAQLDADWGDGRLQAVAGIAYTDDSFRQLLPNGWSQHHGTDGYVRLRLLQDWQQLEDQRSEWELTAQSGSTVARRYRNDAGQAGERIGDNRLRADTVWTTFQHRMPLVADTFLQARLSGMAAERRVQERFGGRQSTAMSLSDAHWSPALSVHWQAKPGIDLWAGRSRSYEPPGFADLLFTTGPMPARQLASRPLEWQRSDSWEWGISLAQEALEGSLVFYHADWRNELLNLVDEDGAARGTVNADRSRHRGLQASLAYAVVDSESLRAQLLFSYTYSEAHFRRDPVFAGNRLAGLPPHLADIRLRMHWGPHWSLEPAVHLRGGRSYVDHANSLSYGSLIDLSLGIGYSPSNDWSLRLQLQNLLDRQQIASPAGVLDRAGMGADTAVFLPAAPRQLQIEFTYNW
ncbi:MAG: TonB-dependent receptor [Opitutales bacterium]|nr:TonB-dependent receptor [Opitutales bacterium]